MLSSSLHGLVVADAFGIPARYVRLCDYEPLFKYRDHYAGTGRALEFATSLPAGLEMGGAPPPVVDKAALLAAFPFDLWGRCATPLTMNVA